MTNRRFVMKAFGLRWIDCGGDACTGDTILFVEDVWSEYGDDAEILGQRTIMARVIRESYGAEKQQHTFTLEVLGCEGHSPYSVGDRILRKGRKIYRNGTHRLKWDD